MRDYPGRSAGRDRRHRRWAQPAAGQQWPAGGPPEVVLLELRGWRDPGRGSGRRLALRAERRGAERPSSLHVAVEPRVLLPGIAEGPRSDRADSSVLLPA